MCVWIGIVDRVKCAAKDDEDPIPVFLDSGKSLYFYKCKLI